MDATHAGNVVRLKPRARNDAVVRPSEERGIWTIVWVLVVIFGVVEAGLVWSLATRPHDLALWTAVALGAYAAVLSAAVYLRIR